MRSWTVFEVAKCVFLFFVFSDVNGFNLDYKIPIIKQGPENSHFGFTVAQHKSFIPGAPDSVSKRYQSWMLVGAPKGENLQPNTNRSGALFKCPLTTYESDCDQVLTDGMKDSNGLFKGTEDGTILPPNKDEIKNDQWMGVTVKSQGIGGDILVCAHRYRVKGEGAQNFQWGYGLCYRLDDNFQFESAYQPCTGKPVEMGHEQFGYCQTGTSGIILEDEVVLGLPGTYNWRGTIHTRNTSRDYLFRDKTEYFGVYTDTDSPVEKYSYLGYSVTAGKFFGDKISYVAGAPRSQGTGQVIFFSRDKLGQSYMDYDLILSGEMFASSFGFEVIAMDTNNDQHDDLVVSAPFYFTQFASGAVYIYQNNGKGITTETPFTRLTGPHGKSGESRFGFSMTSLGDLNADGFNDLAVGAPYDDQGAIYIYLGSQNGIIKEPSQVIRAEDLPGPTYNAFGYALSGGIDLDGNNYPDLLTSAFCSDRVILLRARPIVAIETYVDTSRMHNIDPNRRGCINNPRSSVPCFSFQTCFTITNQAETVTFLEIRYNISEHVYKDNPIHRIGFDHSNLDNSSTVEQMINLKPQNISKPQCYFETVYLRKGIRDVLRPIKFKLSYEINQRDPKPVSPGKSLPEINDYPILNQREAVRYFEATFAKDCGNDDVCMTDLLVLGELDLDRHPVEDRYILELGKRPFFNMTVSVTNQGEPAYVPNLYVQHDKAVDLSPSLSKAGSYQCVSVEIGLVNCKLDNPLLNTTGDIYLVFKPSGLPFMSRVIDIFVWANSTSKEINEEDNKVQFSIEVKRRAEISILGAADPEQVFYSGEVIGESGMEKLSDVGTEVIHKYLIDNRGPVKVDEVKVKILWPYQVENNKEKGKWLLYLTGIPTVDGDGECDVNPRFINPLNLDEEYFVIEGEIETDRLRGYTPRPPLSPTPKITKTSSTKKVISSSTKKTYKKTSSSSKSSSSSSSGTSDQTESGSRNHNRMSRKTYSSSDRNRVTANPDVYEENTDDYDNYDNFFYGNKNDETKGKESSFTAQESKRLNSVEDLRSVVEGGHSYLNGYNSEGDLVWTSRGPINEGGGHSSVHKEVTRRVYTSAGGDKILFDDNNLLLDNLMKDIVDFRIVNDGLQSWVNGYDADGVIIWSSKSSVQDIGIPGGSGTTHRKEYSYSESTRDGKGKRVWSSSVTDQDGTRTSSGSSIISKDRPEDRQHFRTYDSYHGGPSTEKSHSYESSKRVYSSSSNRRVNSADGSSFDWDDRRRDHENGGRWSQSGGFRSKESYKSSQEPDNRTNHQSHSSRNNQQLRTETDLHGNTYNRAVIDPDSGRMNVLTQKVFSRKVGDQWEEVIHGPYHNGEWNQDHNERPLKRTKREREFVIKPQAITDSKTGKTMQIISFTCDGDVPTAKCFEFECTIRNLGANQSASIRVPSRLWNSTLVEDYPRVSYVSIKSKGKLILPDDIRFDQDQSDDMDYAETLAYSNLLEQLPPEQVPMWVIIVSVLAGLLLLVLIAIILYKLGFFKRKRPDPTLSGNLDRDINGYN